jgi:hypothetical protein
MVGNQVYPLADPTPSHQVLHPCMQMVVPPHRVSPRCPHELIPTDMTLQYAEFGEEMNLIHLPFIPNGTLNPPKELV